MGIHFFHALWVFWQPRILYIRVVSRLASCVRTGARTLSWILPRTYIRSKLCSIGVWSAPPAIQHRARRAIVPRAGAGASLRADMPLGAVTLARWHLMASEWRVWLARGRNDGAPITGTRRHARGCHRARWIDWSLSRSVATRQQVTKCTRADS